MSCVYQSKGCRRTAWPMGRQYIVEIPGIVELFCDTLEGARCAALEWIRARPSHAAWIRTLEGDRIGDCVDSVIGKYYQE